MIQKLKCFYRNVYNKYIISNLISFLIKKRSSGLSVREKKNFEFLFESKKNVCFVCSYPRSGNTWLRLLLTDCLLQKKGILTSTELPIHPDQVIPDMQAHDLDKLMEFKYNKLLFVKTHLALHELIKKSPSDSRFIYLFRDPCDALVSFYHFKLRYEKTRSQVMTTGIDQFVIAELRNWLFHAKSAWASRHAQKNIFFIKYENIYTLPAYNLRKLFDWLGIDISCEIVEKAVSNMKFERLRFLEDKMESNSNRERFFRKGQVGAFRDELLPNTIKFIQKNTKYIYSNLSKLS